MKLRIAAILSFLALPVSADEVKFAAESGNIFSSPHTDAMGETHFRGKASISGRYTALWESSSEGETPYLVVRLRPNLKSMSLLPHEVGRGPVEELWLSNTKKALALLVSREIRAKLEVRQLTSVEGDAQVVITSYTTRVDCDVRGYSAKIVSARGLTKVAATTGPIKETSC